MMYVTNENQRVFSEFAGLLTYPEPTLVDRVHALEKRLLGMDPQLAEALDSFVRYVEATPLDRIKEEYTRAFDLSPLAVPYLSVYLFGAENPQRGQFMAGFSGAYAEAGYVIDGELPDHLAVILGYAAVAPEDSWEEVQRLCLPAPLKLMRQALEEAGNPYGHALASLESFLKHVSAGELIHA